MIKSIGKVAAMLAAAAGLLTLAHSASAQVRNPVQFTFLFNAADAWEVWSPIQQADGACPIPGGAACDAFVRGQVSKRHSRDRLFYNTTSSRGGFHRIMNTTCRRPDGSTYPQHDDNYFDQDSGGGTTYGDLTIYCNSGDTLIGYDVTVGSRLF
ncbi:MAG: hypothetical protein QM778_38930 [Myxococcales bacterium]